jgi:hypothetical protein
MPDRNSDEAALRRLINSYARCCDTRDNAGFGALYAPGAVIEGPGFRNDTPEGISGTPAGLGQMFVKTYHTILNNIFDINGDKATGVVYSMAHHLTPIHDGNYNDLVMYITYHDKYVRKGDGWLFEYRRVDMEFTENRLVSNIGAMPKLR